MDETYDLVVVGCGAAGLSTAVSFADEIRLAGREARAVVIERSTEAERGGSTRWTDAGMRVDRDFVLDPGWVQEMQQVTRGRADLDYCRTLEREVPATGRFLQEHGVRFFHADDEIGMGMPVAAPQGGGLTIVDALAGHLEAHHPGVEIVYETEAVSLVVGDEGRVEGVRVRGTDGLTRTLRAPAVMLACGGFEGNDEMLTRYLGPGAINLRELVPGTRFNTGDGIRMAREIGVGPAGQFDGAHMEILDVRSEKPDAVLTGHNYAIVVDAEARRFYDEGEKNRLGSFEVVAFAVWEKADNTAFYITDDAVMGRPELAALLSADMAPVSAGSIGELATLLGLGAAALEQTVSEFNAACGPAEWDPYRYDGKSTTGLVPPKSNWANPIAQPPFHGIPVAAAVCFTYGGLKTDSLSRALSTGGIAIPGLYAAGEIAGNTWYAYPALTSVLRACTFGRIAGTHAAQQLVEDLAASASPARP